LPHCSLMTDHPPARQMYYRNASAAIVCFDITNEDSFTKMKDWVEELKQNVRPDPNSSLI
jgi:GTPase SAR1 family protein